MTNHPNRSKQQQAKHTPNVFPESLSVGSVHLSKCARNHALCDGACAVAYVLGDGYPLGVGWSPRTEALATEIANRYNTHAELLAALKAALCALSYKHGDPLAERVRAAIAKAESR